MSQTKVELLVEARNNASPKLKEVQKDLRGLDQAAGVLSGGLGQMAAMAGFAGVAALGALATEAVRTGFELKNLTAGFERLSAKAGASADSMLAGMKAASQGMISEADLIMSANKAMMLGVAGTTEELVTLMNIAAERGPAMSLTMSQAFNDLVTGLGRGSALILDNLGITVNLTEVNKAYADSLGKSAAALTEVEQKQALVNYVVAQGGNAAALTVDPTQQLAAAWKDFVGQVGLFLSEHSSLPALLSATAGGIDSVNAALQGAATRDDITNARVEAENLRLAIDGLEQQAGASRNLGMTDSAEYVDVMRQLNAAYAERGRAAAEVGVAELGLAGVIDKVTGSAGAEADMAYYQAQAQTNSASTANLEAAAMDVLRAAVDRLKSARDRMAGTIASTAKGIALDASQMIGGEASLQLYQGVKRELSGMEAELRSQKRSEEDIAILVEARGQELRKQYGDLYDATQQTKDYAAAAKAANQEFESLKSTVASILQGALDTGTGVNPDDVLASLGLPREDALNENARRLADIAKNGLKGQDWLNEFRNEVPDIWRAIATASNPQEEAARMLKEFQSGLRPELIDKAKTKELVRAMILGEQSMSAMAEEIATELAAEMGLSVSEVRQAAGSALGVQSAGIGKASGSQFGAGAVEGLKGDGAGTAFVDEFLFQVKALYARIKTAGQEAGKEWGNGFLTTVGTNVPPALVSLLVGLVTPGVEAGLMRNASLTGPQ